MSDLRNGSEVARFWWFDADANTQLVGGLFGWHWGFGGDVFSSNNRGFESLQRGNFDRVTGPTQFNPCCSLPSMRIETNQHRAVWKRSQLTQARYKYSHKTRIVSLTSLFHQGRTTQFLSHSQGQSLLSCPFNICIYDLSCDIL